MGKPSEAALKDALDEELIAELKRRGYDLGAVEKPRGDFTVSAEIWRRTYRE
jgi:hypothetical protein